MPIYNGDKYDGLEDVDERARKESRWQKLKRYLFRFLVPRAK